MAGHGDKVAVVQMTSSANITDNLVYVEQQLAKLNKEGVKLVVLPENFAFMGLNETAKLAITESFQEGLIQTKLSNLAKEYGVWIVAGTIPIRSSDSNKCYASSIVFDDLGNIVARYDKIHLFDVRVSEFEAHKESNSTCAGNEVVTCDTPIGRIGLSVCYDLRFPELYRLLAQAKADIFIVPAAFTYDTGKVHWHTLLKARAIENLSYVVAANQTGIHQNGRKTYGHSMIISPWGMIEASCNYDDTGFAIANIDLNKLNIIRQQFPCLMHRVL